MSVSPFGVIAAGRLPQVPEAIDVSKYLLTIADADDVNHLIVFLTGSTPLPFGITRMSIVCFKLRLTH